MFEAGFIQHASESAKQTLVEGFIIFCFTPKSSWVEKTDGEFTISSQRFPDWRTMGLTGKDRVIISGDAVDVKIVVDISFSFAFILVLSLDLQEVFQAPTVVPVMALKFYRFRCRNCHDLISLLICL